MKNGRKLGLLVAVLTVGVLVAPAFAASQRGAVTVGDFVKDVASAMRLPATDATTAEAAIRSAGYSLPRLNASEPLTQGTVAAIGNSVGLHVASSNPAASFSQSQVNGFLTSMSSSLGRLNAGDSGAANSVENSGQHGKKKPHSKSPKKPKKPRKPHSGHHHGHGGNQGNNG